MGMYGDLQGKVGKSLQEIEGLDFLLWKIKATSDEKQPDDSA